MKQSEEVKMTYSAVVAKKGKPYISVRFERGRDIAEGSIPDCGITNSKGFSSEEVDHLENYMKAHKKEIIEGAKGISGIKNWFSSGASENKK